MRKERLGALDDFVEKCLRVNLTCFVVSVVYLVLGSGLGKGWADGLVGVLFLVWWVALGACLVMTVRLVGKVLRVPHDRKEISWTNVMIALALGVGTWVVSWSTILRFFVGLYIIMNLYGF